MLNNAKLVVFRYIYLSILLSLNIWQLQGQQKANFINGYDLINQLHDGQLLVRLKSHHNKLTALQGELDSTSKNIKYQQRVQKEIHYLMAERDSFNKNLILAMQSNFKFCPVFYFYDKDFPELKKSNFTSSLYLDSTLEAKQNINLVGDVQVIMAVGETKEQGLEAFIFMNKYGNKLPPPFPAYMRLNSLVPLMNGLFYDNHYALDAAHYSKKLQKKFSKLYKKASIREIEEE
ncbi:MAG TPA: hypothetical protein PLN76_13690 [Saprospiraceae bacterium]|nr:hypothetical protein [Saprospiraceae bacterium]